MKAMRMTTTGGPQVLQLADVDNPTLTGDHDLLVRVRAAGINPVDTKLRAKGTYYPDRLPTILGCDGAGVVEAVGPGVTRFAAGDAVYFCHGGIGAAPGTYAEYTVVDERCAARKPVSLDFIQAAAAPLVLITAWEALHDRADLRAGQTALIHAGAGGVGHVALQLAKIAGAQVCTTVGSPEKASFVTRLGADLAIPYKEQDFVTAALDWTDGVGVDVALDTVGGATFHKTAEAVRVYGDLITLLQPGPDTDWKQARLRNLRISLELMLSPMYYGLDDALRHQGWILEQCAKLFDDGQLQVHIQQTFSLEEAAKAHHLIESGGMTGKLVLVTE